MFNGTSLENLSRLPNSNPKSEARNPKQTQRQINLKSGKSKTPNPQEARLEFYKFWSFEIVSNFGFRASNFFFLAPPSTPLRTCFAPLRETLFFCSLLQFRISRAFRW